tara:strand:- start:594 stop:755 length:162 start_codon:yes stop_codon:yes gene_type:complete
MDDDNDIPHSERYWKCSYCDKCYDTQGAVLWHENTYCKYQKKKLNKKKFLIKK